MAATWQSAGVSPKRALDFINRGVLPDTAAKWLKAGVYEGEVLDFMDLGASLEEAADFSRQGLSPWEIEQTSAGLVPIDFEAKRVQDALDQMPNVIEPGYFQFTLSSDPHGYGEKAYDIAFTWDGERSAQFYTDISMYTPGLSVMSSAPMRGTISWRNGRDLRIEYDSEAASQEGTAVLKNQAPTLVDDLISDEASRDPRRWVELADQLIALEYDL